MSQFLLALLTVAAPLQLTAPKDNVDTTLSRAQALYYDARFEESVALLLPLDSELRAKPDALSLNQQVSVKLQIALNFIGLDQLNEARNRFRELCALAPDYSLDPQRFAPKVITLFNEAKAEHSEATCQKICAEAYRLLEVGDAEALLTLIQSAAKCVCLQATALDAASYFYQLGIETYGRDDLVTALKHLRNAARFQPDHDSAGLYIGLIHDRMKLAAERAYLQWGTDLNAGYYGFAATIYRRLQSTNPEDTATQTLEKMRAGYRQRLTPLIESWTRACAAGDTLTMDKVQLQFAELLPDPAVRQELAGDMKCTTQD